MESRHQFLSAVWMFVDVLVELQALIMFTTRVDFKYADVSALAESMLQEAENLHDDAIEEPNYERLKRQFLKAEFYLKAYHSNLGIPQGVFLDRIIIKALQEVDKCFR